VRNFLFIIFLAIVPVQRAAPAGYLSVLYSFGSNTNIDGTAPVGNLIEGKDGTLYGMTLNGGTSNYGTAFQLKNGALTTLCSFVVTNGKWPLGGLIEGGDGNLYGTTYYGGSYGLTAGGTIFRLNTNGTLVVLDTLSENRGFHSTAGLLRGSDGFLYGTTHDGGTNLNGFIDLYDAGTVFRIGTNGGYTVLHSFTNGDGTYPQAGLYQGKNGTFYGTTSSGGLYGRGTVFSLTTNGAFALLSSFDANDYVDAGADPVASVIQGADGALYGTTLWGGDLGIGTVFKLTEDGWITALCSFNSTNGSLPWGNLIQDNNGFLYGTTLRGGTWDKGTIFKLTTNGIFTLLYEFSGSDGSGPRTGLLLGSDGSFYGNTQAGGAYNLGEIFEFVMPPSLEISVWSSNIRVSWPSSANAFRLQQSDNLSAGNWIASGFPISDDASNKSITIPAPTGKLFFRLKRE
jgi:uncharacterized repeat protein (TIGR03803 family)